MQVVLHKRVNDDLLALSLLGAFDMPRLPALHASKHSHLLFRVITSPRLQTPDLLMPARSTPVALNDVAFLAISGQVTDLVAFEADLLRTHEGVVGVFPA